MEANSVIYDPLSVIGITYLGKVAGGIRQIEGVFIDKMRHEWCFMEIAKSGAAEYYYYWHYGNSD